MKVRLLKNLSYNTISQLPIPLDRINILTPCQQSWKEMEGDVQVKFCGECHKSVYNLSALTQREAAALLKEKQSKLCARFYKDDKGQIQFVEGIIARLQRRLGRTRRFHGLAAAVSVLLSLISNQNLRADDGDRYEYHDKYQYVMGDIDYSVVQRTLDSDSLIDGVLWSKGTRLIDDKVVDGILGENARIQGILWMKGTSIKFGPDLKIHFGVLAEDTQINGILWGRGAQTYFDRNGILSSVILIRNTEIGGLLFQKNTEIKFYANRKISYGYLANDASIQGVQWQKEMRIGFHSNGAPSYGILVADTLIRNILWMHGTEIAITENGEILYGTPVNDVDYQGIRWSKGTKIGFFREKNDWSGIDARALPQNALTDQRKWTRQLPKVKIKAESVAFGTLAQDTEVLRIKWAKGSLLGFYANGLIRVGALAEDTVITGKMYKKGTIINFGNTGKVITDS